MYGRSAANVMGIGAVNRFGKELTMQQLITLQQMASKGQPVTTGQVAPYNSVGQQMPAQFQNTQPSQPQYSPQNTWQKQIYPDRQAFSNQMGTSWAGHHFMSEAITPQVPSVYGQPVQDYQFHNQRLQQLLSPQPEPQSQPQKRHLELTFGEMPQGMVHNPADAVVVKSTPRTVGEAEAEKKQELLQTKIQEWVKFGVGTAATVCSLALLGFPFTWPTTIAGGAVLATQAAGLAFNGYSSFSTMGNKEKETTKWEQEKRKAFAEMFGSEDAYDKYKDQVSESVVNQWIVNQKIAKRIAQEAKERYGQF